VRKKKLLGNVLMLLIMFLLVSSVTSVSAQDDDTTTTEVEDDDDDDDSTTTEVEDDDEDDDGVDDDEEDLNEREVEVEVTASEATIKSKLKSGENEAEFKIKLSTSTEGVKYKLEYETEDNATEIELEFTVKFSEIVEYIDEDGDGLYNSSIDTELQTLQLNDFLPIGYHVENETDGVVHILDVSTSDGVFSVRTYATGEFADINGTIVTPTEVKIDVMIQDFDYLNDTSQLALKVKLEAEAETEHDDETEDEEEGRATDEAEVDVMMNGFDGFFSWKEFAEVDGVTYPVNASPVEEDEGDEKIYLNYPHGNVIIHDPKVGVENILLTPAGPSPLDGILASGYLPIIAVAAFAIVGLAIVAKRRS
jgi:hypothetical protein